MLVKHDSCRLINTESSLYTISCNVDTVECVFVIGKGIPPHKYANFCILLFFALNIHRDHIQVSFGVLLHPCFKRHFLNDG